MILDIGTLKMSKWPAAKKWLIDNNIISLEELDFNDWLSGFNIEMSEVDAVAFKLKFQL
jgi:hypothetical protein